MQGKDHMSSMGPQFGVGSALIILMLSACCLPAAEAAEYSTPRQLSIFDVYQLNPDGATGDEATTEPKTDLNNGLNGDNPYFQRTKCGQSTRRRLLWKILVHIVLPGTGRA